MHFWPKNGQTTVWSVFVSWTATVWHCQKTRLYVKSTVVLRKSSFQIEFKSNIFDFETQPVWWCVYMADILNEFPFSSHNYYPIRLILLLQSVTVTCRLLFINQKTFCEIQDLWLVHYDSQIMTHKLKT